MVNSKKRRLVVDIIGDTRSSAGGWVTDNSLSSTPGPVSSAPRHAVDGLSASPPGLTALVTILFRLRRDILTGTDSNEGDPVLSYKTALSSGQTKVC
ncbi:hypothetical protein RRG08_029172 [Elysia crispata]|uniref:Uncharacterized protein n=1 Tax=Elysia crispata TaxID=231223 RepID=A0AAE1AJD3_9GAST|nr:hypothetical protein RRG08_029172 [Elysia crispata]